MFQLFSVLNKELMTIGGTSNDIKIRMYSSNDQVSNATFIGQSNTSLYFVTPCNTPAYVGIGTVTPQANLHIQGSVLTNLITITDTGTYTAQSSTISQNMVISAITCTTITTQNNTINAGSGSFYASNINFTGQLLQNGTPFVSGGGISSQWTTSNTIAQTGSNSVYIVGSNIGIGTAVPQSNLDLWGTFGVTINNQKQFGISSNQLYYGYDTATIPYIYGTTLNVSTTSTLNTVTASNITTTTINTQNNSINAGSGTMNVANISCTSVSASNPLVFRNAIINGGMAINQRGISTNWSSPTAIGAVSTLYATDRWNTYRAGGVTGGAIAQGSNAITDQPYKDGIQYYLRIGRVSGDTGTADVIATYNLETRDSYRFAGQSVTLSFYYRTGSGYSGASGIYVYLYSSTGTDQSYRGGLTGSVTVANQTFVTSSTWQRVAVTGSVPTSSSQLTLGIGYTPSGTAGANDYFDITGVQLEMGTVMTPFEYRPYTTELIMCKRYFQKFDSAGSGQNYFAGLAGGIYSYVCSIVTFQLTVPMRVRPSQYWYTDRTPQMMTVSGTTTNIDRVGDINGSGTAVVLPALCTGHYGYDSPTDTTMITLLPVSTTMTNPGTNVPLFIRQIHIDWIAEL